MKKIFFLFYFLFGISFVSALTCVDLQTNLSKGNENNSVKLLQTFLSEKGFLKSTPNGYFGSATVTALKEFQKSQNISQVGTTGPSTRSLIKKLSCTENKTLNKVQDTCLATDIKFCGDGTVMPRTAGCTWQPEKCTVPPKNQSSSSVLPAIATLQVPYIESIDKATFLSGATMDAGLVIRGKNFSTKNNQIIFKIPNSNRSYVMSTQIASTATGTLITVPSTFTSSELSCGSGCKEKLAVGPYAVIVKTEGGESNEGYISIRSINVSSTSGANYSSIKQQSTQVNLGTITLGSSISLSLENLSLSINGSPFDVSKISNIKLKDEMTGVFVNGGGYNYDLAKTTLIENQSKIYGVYADINSPISGAINVSGVLKARDFIGNNLMQVQIPTFYVTISG